MKRFLSILIVLIAGLQIAAARPMPTALQPLYEQANQL